MRFCFNLVTLGCIAVTAYAGSAPERTAHPRSGIKSVVRVDKRTGKLVRTVADRSASARPAHSAVLRETVERIAAEHALPPGLIDSVIRVESDYNPFAISPKGALGLMQLIPSTARRFGVADVFDPVENIQGGARYLRYLLDLYGGDYTLALAAYNAGEGAVAKYRDVPPYPETRNYVSLVGRELAERAIEQQGRSPEKPADEQPLARKDGPPEPAHIEAIAAPDGTVRYVSR